MKKEMTLCGTVLLGLLLSGHAVQAEEVESNEENNVEHIVTNATDVSAETQFSVLVENAEVLTTTSVKEDETSNEENGGVPSEEHATEAITSDSVSLLSEKTNKELLTDTQLSEEMTATPTLTVSEVSVKSQEAELSEEPVLPHTTFLSPEEEDRYHIIKSGDSLWAIANRYGTTVSELVRINQFSSASVMIYPGDKIKVFEGYSNPVKPSPQPESSEEVYEEVKYHTVVSGDSLWRIATQNGITVPELVTLNGFKSSNVLIHPGDKLIVGKVKVSVPKVTQPISQPSQPTQPTNPSAPTQEATQYYTVSAGDSLWKIATAHGITVDELVRLNGFSSSNVMIHPNQKLIVRGKRVGGDNSVPSSTPSSNSAETIRQQLVDTAKQYLGVPYVWGGKTPAGFDCSGFVRYVYMQVTGKNIGEWTVPQERAGVEASLSALKAGDLLFYGSRGATYHVSMYIGNGQYIHAPQPGQNVSIGAVQYYHPDFARRIILD